LRTFVIEDKGRHVVESISLHALLCNVENLKKACMATAMATSATVGHAIGAETLLPTLEEDGVTDAIIKAAEPSQ
jgi:hypothetical protein